MTAEKCPRPLLVSRVRSGRSSAVDQRPSFSRRLQLGQAPIEGGTLSILAFDNTDALEAGQIRATLAESGQLTGPYDLQIAGQARRRGLVLVSNNPREFERVKGVRLENWV
ncbi:PIN domain-containing protein [Endothiovibrio diazotrophicus]